MSRMEEVEGSVESKEDELGIKLTLSDDTEIIMLARDLQQEACRGICEDIIISQLACDESQHDYQMSSHKHWPLAVVERDPTSAPLPAIPLRKRLPSLLKSHRRNSNPVARNPDSVVLVFVDQDEGSCDYAIEVCSSPADKISDLQALEHAIVTP